jgi:rod shape-determining protein MreD
MDALKAAALLFLAVLVQVSVLGGWTPLGGSPDFLLVTLLSVALLRGSIFGAAAGFGAGLLYDTAMLGRLGFTSLLLTVAGFWIGRYGETTARDRFHAPYVSVFVVTILYAVGALALRFVIGDSVPAHAVISALPAGILWNLVLTLPVYALVRRLHPPAEAGDRAYEVRLLG